MKSRKLSMLLAAAIALTAAGCGSSDSSGSSGAGNAPTASSSSSGAAAGGRAPVSITVDCQPPKTNAASARLGTRTSRLSRSSTRTSRFQGKDAFPCINPRHLPGQARRRQHGGRLLRLLHRRPDRSSRPGRPPTSRRTSSEREDVRRTISAGRDERLQGGRQGLRPADATTTPWAWSTTASCSPRPGSTRTTRRRPGPRCGRPPRRSPRSATATSASASTAPATPAAGTSPPRSTAAAARWSTRRRQEGRLQQRRGQGGPAEPQGHALGRQQHGQPSSCSQLGRPDDG